MTRLIEYFDSLNKILDKKERQRILRIYNKWIECQTESIIDGIYCEYEDGDIPHHLKVVGYFGMGKRPNDLFRVPIRKDQHHKHHQHYPMYQDIMVDKIPDLHERFIVECNITL